MIQKFNIDINTIINNKSISYLNPLTLDEFTKMEKYLSNHLDISGYHYHNAILCKSPNLKNVRIYQRNYITFTNNKVNEGMIDITVVYCSSDGHYHAILPLNIIVPYCQYSLSFILCVIFDKFYSSLTVEEIVDKYHISKSTVYRWMEKYSAYLSYYYRLRNKYRYSIFIPLRYLFGEVLNDIFDMCGKTLFQRDCKLFKPPV